MVNAFSKLACIRICRTNISPPFLIRQAIVARGCPGFYFLIEMHKKILLKSGKDRQLAERKK